MTAADKPRADLVALLLQFEACSAERGGRMGTLYLSGDDAAAAIRAWADIRGHHVVIGKRTRVDSYRRTLEYTHYRVEDTSHTTYPAWEVTCSLHDDCVVTQPDEPCEHWPVKHPDDEQPAAEGSV